VIRGGVMKQVVRWSRWLVVLALLALALPAVAQEKKPSGSAQGKPNILIIWGDDIGQSDVSAYSMGLMGFRTPNIDRVAREGMIFTDFYAEQSCTAGRASFITGQSGLRTGLTKVGLPGAAVGLQKEDPTIAELLKPLGYATGQFGKNHLGDRNEYLPTVHGFDEFYGNLYHLNAEEEPELPDYPKDPAFRAKFGPRGVLDCKASAKDDTTVDLRFGKVGKQVCTDTGPLTKKRMETIDDDVANRAVDFIQRQNKGDTQVKEKLLKGSKVGNMTYKVHLDGDNLVPYLTGQVAKSPRESFIYINDDQQLVALRYDNWKLVFLEQRAPGTLLIWANPFTDGCWITPSCWSPRRPSWASS
jgi:arylsulfatase A-like enzyme